MPPDITRVVAFGASNLTRGFQPVVSSARDEWGPEVEVVAALGLGRSYGMPSRLWGRGLPGILQCGLWQALERLPPAPTRALITDVGNDILYGAPADEIVGWVGACVDRLQPFTRDIVLTDLPLANALALRPAKFLLFRTILFPKCRLSLTQVIDIAERVVAGLEQLAADRGARFFRLKCEWYGFDPIHIRPRCWREAWREILCGNPYVAPTELGSALRTSEAVRLFTLRPERQWIMGFEQVTPQPGVRLRRGGRVWLY
jgi:hypothetical protein